ncbi:hypothetical protein SNK03_13589 [Fusarium graminearum]|uniref:Chromosome 2, complete genome n=1 Tax=Gibberella zeae (strain ATCC MYA-4620 / CBS 123657 / FGSC 9075 / NRRL 31084 / PH-1) TaxID=229533 RepID=I1S904_GIBZE|nr:hypothetical protein FGSG_13334 [Fusarium graminearum PH-1]ESU14715.1 hypothetical protein FGSG_13334 [Fusarium graminearum PH-1]CEF76988.1 unnamed protein product [Fusarium graminearum]CZS80280.1 unnamed protein product [Fusarium graminearum]|eukprot:XP_011320140.1 hypothetical protein FGSG_13334 [Fusarium graminearum PH-1]
MYFTELGSWAGQPAPVVRGRQEWSGLQGPGQEWRTREGQSGNGQEPEGKDFPTNGSSLALLALSIPPIFSALNEQKTGLRCQGRSKSHPHPLKIPSHSRYRVLYVAVCTNLCPSPVSLPWSVGCVLPTPSNELMALGPVYSVEIVVGPKTS